MKVVLHEAIKKLRNDPASGKMYESRFVEYHDQDANRNEAQDHSGT